MKIYDENNVELFEPDLSLGRLVEDRILRAIHETVQAVSEEGHWETVAEYPNGGKDVAWIVDVPKVEPKEAWDEYEDILRFVRYTAEELAQIEEEKNRPTHEQRIVDLENAVALVKSILSGLTNGFR